ncbi:hypothetical protein F4809DRAFT_104137 [Biscogniauxia mediterranea]|nr:hypothetical protein F4809DRAFT_104137 [Biscogniauxia mediterranea]
MFRIAPRLTYCMFYLPTGQDRKRRRKRAQDTTATVDRHNTTSQPASQPASQLASEPSRNRVPMVDILLFDSDVVAFYPLQPRSEKPTFRQIHWSGFRRPPNLLFTMKFIFPILILLRLFLFPSRMDGSPCLFLFFSLFYLGKYFVFLYLLCLFLFPSLVRSRGRRRMGEILCIIPYQSQTVTKKKKIRGIWWDFIPFPPLKKK